MERAQSCSGVQETEKEPRGGLVLEENLRKTVFWHHFLSQKKDLISADTFSFIRGEEGPEKGRRVGQARTRSSIISIEPVLRREAGTKTSL